MQLQALIQATISAARARPSRPPRRRPTGPLALSPYLERAMCAAMVGDFARPATPIARPCAGIRACIRAGPRQPRARAVGAARDPRFELPASRWSSSVSYSLGPTSRVAPGNSSRITAPLEQNLIMKQPYLHLTQLRRLAPLALGATLIFAACGDQKTPAKTSANAPAKSAAPAAADEHKPAVEPAKTAAEQATKPAADQAQKPAPAPTNAKVETKDATPVAAARPTDPAADKHFAPGDQTPAKDAAPTGPPARLDTDATDHDFG